ncbi:MAG TPA: winged helix-turn-helix transcriptional regulator [Candidatus Paceibacterota bacterium]
MPDETTPEPPIPESTPAEAPAPMLESVSPQATVSESQTAQIPANEPIAPTSEPLPEPAPQLSAPVSVVAPVLHLVRDLAAKARAVIQSRKRAKLEKILAAIAAKGSITNDEVEKLLHVSDATATRYLAQLEKEGKISQIGKTGKSVKYTKAG